MLYALEMTSIFAVLMASYLKHCLQQYFRITKNPPWFKNPGGSQNCFLQMRRSASFFKAEQLGRLWQLLENNTRGAIFMVCVIKKRIELFCNCSCFDNALLFFALKSNSCCWVKTQMSTISKHWTKIDKKLSETNGRNKEF